LILFLSFVTRINETQKISGQTTQGDLGQENDNMRIFLEKARVYAEMPLLSCVSGLTTGLAEHPLRS